MRISLLDPTRILHASLCWALLTPLCWAQPRSDRTPTSRSGGGFFNQGFATEDQLSDAPTATPTAEPTLEPTPAPQVSAQPTPLTYERDQTNDIAAQIRGSQHTIEDIKSGNAPKLDFKGTFENLKQSIDRRSQRMNGTPEATPLPIEVTPTPTSYDFETLMAMNRQQNIQTPILLPAPPTSGTSISVILSAEPKGNMLRALDRMMYVHEKLGVQIGSIAVIGKSSEFALANCLSEGFMQGLKRSTETKLLTPDKAQTIVSKVKEAIPTSVIILERLGLKRREGNLSGAKFIEAYQLETSPNWIVTENGREYLFQGPYDVNEFFDASGRFNPPPDGAPQNTLGPDGRELVRFAPRPGPVFPKQDLEFASLYIPVKKEQPLKNRIALTTIPLCEKEDVRREEVGASNPTAGFSIDVLLYSRDEPRQVERASKWKRMAVPYDTHLPYEQAVAMNPLLPTVTSLGIRCLPTRFHYINVGTRQFAEYREGRAAWVETPNR